MDLKDMVSKATDEFFSNFSEPIEDTQKAPEQPVGNTDRLDLLQQGRNERFEMGKKQFPKGSSKRVRQHAAEIAERLRPVYKRAKSDSDVLKSRGDKQRARMVIDQYMEEQFLPTIEAMILMDGVDEVLNSKEALRLLDEYVLLNAGSGSGYTRSYIMSLYDKFRGQTQSMSDHEVMKSIGKIHKLIETDEIRTAIALANKIKDKIDAGENQASDEDYDLIATIVARGQ